MCSWCKRVDVEGAWSDVEAAVQRLRLFELTSLPQITHGICEPCLGGMLELLGKKKI